MPLQQKIARIRQLAEQASANVTAFKEHPYLIEGSDAQQFWGDVRDSLTEYASVLQRDLERSEPECLEIPRFLRKQND